MALGAMQSSLPSRAKEVRRERERERERGRGGGGKVGR